MKELTDFLGHESTSTSEIYTHVNRKNMVKAARNSPMTQLRLKDIQEVTAEAELVLQKKRAEEAARNAIRIAQGFDPITNSTESKASKKTRKARGFCTTD